MKAYDDQNFDELKNLYEKTRKMDVSRLEWEFYSALFMTDGEEAKDQFQQVFDQSQGQLKKYAAKKIMDYYYAKGYYINAGKYQQYLVDKEPEPIRQVTPEPVKQAQTSNVTIDENTVSEYYIQVGAFSLQDNADQLKKMLSTQDINTLIVTREVNNKTLYCVWLPGKGTFEQTLQYANSIQEKFELKFRIIKQ